MKWRSYPLKNHLQLKTEENVEEGEGQLGEITRKSTGNRVKPVRQI